jgi:hypothetical protein
MNIEMIYIPAVVYKRVTAINGNEEQTKEDNI